MNILVILPSPLAPHLGQSKRIGLHLIVESRYAGDYSPWFQAKFGVAGEVPDGPWVGLAPRYR